MDLTQHIELARVIQISYDTDHNDEIMRALIPEKTPYTLVDVQNVGPVELVIVKHKETGKDSLILPGSDEPQDWWAHNLRIGRKRKKTLFHQGFREYTLQVIDLLVATRGDEFGMIPIFETVAGHSLGGAAALMLFDIYGGNMFYNDPNIVTFGAPPVSVKGAAPSSIEFSEDVTNYVTRGDQIPYVSKRFGFQSNRNNVMLGYKKSRLALFLQALRLWNAYTTESELATWHGIDTYIDWMEGAMNGEVPISQQNRLW